MKLNLYDLFFVRMPNYLNRLSNKVFKKNLINKIYFSNILIKLIFLKTNKKYRNRTNEHDYNNPNMLNIWILWWDGIENAPLTVKTCIQSIIKNKNGHQVIILDKNNLNNYICLPSFIIEKFNKSIIPITAFSDIIRNELLSKYGGLWLDATVYVSKPIPDVCFQSYYSLHCNEYIFGGLYIFDKIVKGRWAIFVQGGHKNNIINSYCRDILYDYWNKFDRLYDYFFTDLIILYGYKNFKNYKILIDAIPQEISSHKNCFKLTSILNDFFDKNHLNNILNSAIFFKLSHKENYKTKINGKLTNYGLLTKNIL